MAGGKETPRQKMIGMMYLVLTALLALNVSKEILNAFVIIEDSLNITNENFDAKNELLYQKFAKAVTENPDRAKPWQDKALSVQKQSKELCLFIDDIKSQLYQKIQKLPKEQADTLHLMYLESKDENNIPTELLIGAGADAENATGLSKDLKEKIETFKKNITNLVPEKDRSALKIGLSTEDMYSIGDERMVKWESNLFAHQPAAAVLSILAKLKNDVKNAESDVVSTLLRNVDESTIKFDKVMAKVVAPSNYIISGEEYKADIFIAAYNSSSNPEILLGNVDTATGTIKGTSTKLETFENGLGKYSVKTGSEGQQEFGGVINVKSQDGSVKSYPFTSSYMVARPSMAVSPTKMNVFYIGVDNPVAISVAGAAPTDVVASLTGATGSIVSQGQGNYIVKVSAGTKCDINVSVKTKTGTKSMGKMEFRVKKVPSPLASFAGVTGDGVASKGELTAAGGVIPKLEDFVFDLKFPVVSWVMSMNINGVFVDQAASGPGKTGAMSEMISKAKPGTKILIEQVKVQAPDGVRKIPGCVIKVK
ncbi:MAG: gliding motility protein GldM [Bacteroidia bacterium]|nr:gliding motility protein GldM [Bacteroidia bacterium]